MIASIQVIPWFLNSLKTSILSLSYHTESTITKSFSCVISLATFFAFDLFKSPTTCFDSKQGVGMSMVSAAPARVLKSPANSITSILLVSIVHFLSEIVLCQYENIN